LTSISSATIISAMSSKKYTAMTVKIDLDIQTWNEFKFLCKKKDHKTVQGVMAELVSEYVENRKEEAAICRQS